MEKQARVEFIGWQEGYGHAAPFALFNVWRPGMLSSTTLSVDTLRAQGISVPPFPTFEEWRKIHPEEGR